MSSFNIKLFEDYLRFRYDLENWRIIYLESVDSTSSEIMRRISKGEEKNLIVIASKQDSGRGRSGNFWYSQTCGNLYISTSLTLQTQVVDHLSLIPLAAGVSIVTALSYEGIKDILLKWPNDLIYQDKKIGGILCETPGIEEKTKIIVGLGLNCEETSFPEELQNIAISLPRISSKKLDIQRVAANWICELEDWRHKLSKGMTSLLIESWTAHGEPFGRRVRVANIEGITVKLNEFGRLQIKQDNGTIVDIPGGIVENIDE